MGRFNKKKAPSKHLRIISTQRGELSSRVLDEQGCRGKRNYTGAPDGTKEEPFVALRGKTCLILGKVGQKNMPSVPF